jgi:hypothetical protein
VTWPTLTERLDHRHVSHFYGVWPADEIDPDNTPQLAKAVWLANRKRAQEESSGFGLAHRALAGVLTSQPESDATRCVLHLPKNKPVTIQIKLGQHKPSDWILKMASQN